MVLDANGNAVARFEYGPYGVTTAAGTAAAEVRYRYTGHPWDEAQGVYETPARGYDPTLGRFLSVDPQRQDASPYVYAGNNPVGYVDPTGGGKVVPFVIMSGLNSYDSHEDFTTRSIGDVLGMAPKQKILEATNVFGQPGDRSRYKPDKNDIRRTWEGKGRKGSTKGRAYEYNEKLYWFIGDEQELQIPGDIKRRAAVYKEVSKDMFGRDIVLIDISQDGTSYKPIVAALNEADLNYRVVRANVTAERAHGKPGKLARYIDVIGGRMYDIEQAQDKLDFRTLIETSPKKMPLAYQPGTLGPDIKGGAGPGNQLPETVPSLEHTTTSLDAPGMDTRGVGFFTFNLDPFEGVD